MANCKFYFTAFTLGIVLSGISTGSAFAQQGDAKTIDKFNELNQLLPKEQSANPWVQKLFGKVVPDVRYSYTPSKPLSSFKDTKVKVYIDGKETFVDFPYLGKPYATTMPARVPAFSMPSKSGATYKFIQPRLDKMPVIVPNMNNYNMPVAKPDMDNYNMPVVQPGLKKPTGLPLLDTVKRK